MGHFSMTCSISGLAITGGTPVRCLLLTSSPYEEESIARTAWSVRTPPLRAEYNDYGTIENVHEDDKFIADLWLRGLQEDLVEKGLGDNSCHDTATVKEMKFDQLLDALRENRVEVTQDSKHFWRRPLADDYRPWLANLKEEDRLPLFKRIEKLLVDVGAVSPEGEKAKDTFVCDEPVPNLVRVRYGQYQHGKAYLAALEAAKAAIEKAGFAAVITTGSGRYADEANVLVFYTPDPSRHHKGPQWDMAAGQSADGNKKLRVRLAMIREDVWQALISYPHSDSVWMLCHHCNQPGSYHEVGTKLCPNNDKTSHPNWPYKKHPKGTRYERGDVFPKDIPHIVQQREYGETVWFGAQVFKHSVRTAWSQILSYYEREDKLRKGVPLKPEEEKALSPDIEKIVSDMRKAQAKERERVAALPKEEQEKIRAEAEARLKRYEEAEQQKRENPIFGDFPIEYAFDQKRDAPGSWIFRHDVPGVIGIPQHMSMCLADKKDVPESVLDALAELSIFQRSMHEVGCSWKPCSSTGPQDPDWREHVRYLGSLLNIARKEAKRYEDRDEEDDDRLAVYPATLGEVVEKIGAKTPKSSKKKKS